MTVHACLREGGGGSPTAVVDEASSSPSGHLLTDDERRAVPALAGTSHAAFLSQDGERAAGSGDDRPVVTVRFFTAEGELPACGHGTVAALAFLAQRAGGREYQAALRVAGASSRVAQCAGRHLSRPPSRRGRSACVSPHQVNSRCSCPLWDSARRSPPERASPRWDVRGSSCLFPPAPLSPS
nr:MULTISPECIES: PhzF family phenazine biosynthesis protein [unclassified Streptomyces]